MIRPFISPDQLIEHSSYQSVQNREHDKLANDIKRAELFIMQKCDRTFDDVEADSVTGERLVMAVIMLAEMYAFNAELKATAVNSSGGGRSLKSESEKDYNYQYADTSEDMITFDDIGLESMLEPLKTSGNYFMRFTIL